LNDEFEITKLLKKYTKELTWKERDDPLHFFLESNLENSIRFIDNETLEVLGQKLRRIVEMVEKSPRSCHKECDAFF
jgi:hypothetical protein